MADKKQAVARGRAVEDVRVALMETAVTLPEIERRRGPAPQPPRLVLRPSRTDPQCMTIYIRDKRVEVSTRLPEQGDRIRVLVGKLLLRKI